MLYELDDIFKLAVKSNWSIAAYRKPNEASLRVLVQKEPCRIVKYDDEIGRGAGFIAAPFNLDGVLPTLLLQHDYEIVFEEGAPLKVIANDKDLDLLWNSLISLKEDHSKPIWHVLQDQQFHYSDREEYLYSVNHCIEELQKRNLDKVVLSRQHPSELPEHFKPGRFYLNLCERYPEMFVCMFSSPQGGTWIGASPELLLQIDQQHFSTVSLAGTTSRKTKVFKSLWGSKEQDEQEWVSLYLKEKMLELGMKDIQIDGPSTCRAGNLSHIKTVFNADFNMDISLSNVIQSFHPTPAVCGSPKEEASKYLGKFEKHSRAYYGGFWGAMDANSNTSLYVNLRCMQLLDDKAVLYVGGGITRDSIAENEWEETKLKASTLLNLFQEA